MNWPNYLTLLRIVLVPVFLSLLIAYDSAQEGYRIAALCVFIAAILTDALDGFLARIRNERTELGTFLDPLADKLLLLSGYIGIMFVEKLPHHPPFWITVTIVFRDIIIVAGMIVLFMVTRTIKAVEPNLAGKATTVLQMAGLVAILIKHSASIWLWHATAVLTIFSGILYVRRGIRALAGRAL